MSAYHALLAPPAAPETYTLSLHDALPIFLTHQQAAESSFYLRHPVDIPACTHIDQAVFERTVQIEEHQWHLPINDKPIFKLDRFPGTKIVIEYWFIIDGEMPLMILDLDGPIFKLDRFPGTKIVVDQISDCLSRITKDSLQAAAQLNGGNSVDGGGIV